MEGHVLGSVDNNSDDIPAFAERNLGAINNIFVFLFLLLKNSVDNRIQNLQDVVLQNWSIKFDELLHELKIAWVCDFRCEAVQDSYYLGQQGFEAWGQVTVRDYSVKCIDRLHGDNLFRGIICIAYGFKKEVHSFLKCILVLCKQHVGVVTKQKTETRS